MVNSVTGEEERLEVVEELPANDKRTAGKAHRGLALGLDLWAAGRLQVLLDNGIRVALLHDLAEDLLANLLAVFLADDARGHLAGAESRDIDLSDELLEPRFDQRLDIGGQIRRGRFQRGHHLPGLVAKRRIERLVDETRPAVAHLSRRKR